MNSQVQQESPEMNQVFFTNEPCKPIFRPKGEAPFKDSWEAEAYAIGNLLVKLDYLTSKEWMNLMAESIEEAQNHGDSDTGETYYHHWCRSIEKFCFLRGISDPDQHQKILDLWKKAILNTPHGVSLAIENAFFDTHDPILVSPSVEHTDNHIPTQPHSIHQHYSHQRPAIPPENYFKPIAKQILRPSLS
jgi:hypothetical protein